MAEIISQVWLAINILAKKDEVYSPAKQHNITNVVLMGMGEPLLNFDNEDKEKTVKDDREMTPRTSVSLSTHKPTEKTE